ncbi:hypothetical protein CkaCkLH20_03959 [Colletotrichum karsti]|uniref:Transmembrane protein 53 n=1 Tax=Colletotrichum karsti TaxID=1095194 RepID=A0A9P6I9Y0_9PEZI|nr:uncharacterized protein CkaCkLH20_03959 [Colletotrichum karsti]KAF9878467.1 hypothetical protein CkaCkLH20_03959 [Colletotrichum karsti]
MVPLSPNTFLYEPPSGASADPNSPKLIVLFTWMSAQDVHIAKYTSRYTALYPTARILLVKCPFIHTLSARIAKREIKPAVSVVRALADTTATAAPGETARPQLLLHVFSNGGATNLAKFYELYAAADRAGRLELPPHVTVYDSCPGGFHWMRSYRALSAALPRFLAPFVHVIIGWFWIFQIPFGKSGIFGKMWNALKHRALLQSEQRRVYLYSKEDEMIYWGDVEKHANEAKEVGFQVERERFEGSQHVAHARLDGDRYWGTVKQLWDGKEEAPSQEEAQPEQTQAKSAEVEPAKTESAKTETVKTETAKPIVVEPEAKQIEAKQPETPKTEPVQMNGAPLEVQVLKPEPATELEQSFVEVVQPTPVKPEVARQPEVVRRFDSFELVKESDLLDKQPEVVTASEIGQVPEVVKLPEPVMPEPPKRKKRPSPPPTIQ